MVNVAILQLNTAFSGLISLVYFIVSTVYLDDVVKRYPDYGDSEILLLFVVLGVWMSLFKLGITIVIFHKLEEAWKFWIKSHMLFFIAAVISFSVTVSHTDISMVQSSKGQAFVGFAAIEFLFSFFGSILTYYMGRDTSY